MRNLFAAFYILVSAAPASASFSFATDEADRLQQAFYAGTHNVDADNALDAMIHMGAKELRQAGFDNSAIEIEHDWETKYKGFLLGKNLGDHAPVQWLLQVYTMLDALLGDRVMKLTHLDDLYIFAYSIPVVFWCEDHVDAHEYQLHFVPFAGSLAYWVAYIACSAALFESPYAIICSPVGSACETIVRFVAPRFNDRVWARACQG